MKLNNKGFTLVEVLAVVVVLAVIMGIAVPSVLSTINTSKEASYKIMVSNIVTASQSFYEEIEYGDITLYEYTYDSASSSTVKSSTIVSISSNTISTNLQTLVSNGYLSGTSDEENDNKILLNPNDKENIGNCEIKIEKTVDSNYNVTYTITSTSSNTSCPTTEDYEKGIS